VKQEKREVQIGVSLTESEYETIRRAAFDAHLSMSAYMRAAALAEAGETPIEKNKKKKEK
jgi:uncharacterized protein (DUF1778 family)